MLKRVSGHLRVLCASFVLFGTAVSIGTLAIPGIAGADYETHSGTQWVGTGWVHEPFFTCEDSCPVWSWALYNGGITWESWNFSGGGSYDLLTQDFWEGLLGSEAGSGDPSNHDAADLYITGYGSAHLNGGTTISTNVGDGTCPQIASPAYLPCEESQHNANGYKFNNPKDDGYIEYGSNFGYPAEYPNGAQTLNVLTGYIS
jgi:hypothetical protein